MSLPDQRPRRELYWLSLMPDTKVTALASEKPVGDVDWIPASYRRPIRRFVEAGALAWVQQMKSHESDVDWVASLELCSLVTGQAARWAERASQPRRGRRVRQAVLTWENLAGQPLYRLPPYRNAFRRAVRADLLLCMVDAARDHLLQLGVEDERIRVVKPGVDTETFYPVAEPVEDPVLAFVSPLAPNKGIDRVLDAFELVRRAIPGARLMVAGRGPLEARVRAAAEAGNGVEYHGSLSIDGVADLMRQAAVFTTAPRPTWKWTEQFGLAYTEAMACGLPVVTTVCGSNDEAVPDRNLRVPDDVEALAEGLVLMLGDVSRRRAVGTHNRRHVLAHHELVTQCAAMGEAFASVERADG